MTSTQYSETLLYSSLATDPELAEIVDMFVLEMPDRIAKFLALLEGGQMEELRRVAHQLKGAAGSYGFEPITQAAALLENAIRESRLEAEIHHATDELVALCRSARTGTGS